jgi:Rrf2 family iron-sulfur cluster assembly transcriptional regulator
MMSAMLLPQTAEYALRALACLVRPGPGDAGLRSADIAELSGVPPAYLQKILRRLVAAGLLESQKGHGGGFRLARDPARIRFEDVLEAVEGESKPRPCAFGWSRCDASRPCPLHPAYAELKESFRAWAARMTLADVLDLPARRRRQARSSG